MIEGLAAHWPEIAVALASVAACALVGGLLTDVGPWYESLNFPRLRPPNWLFGPAWSVIFLLIAAAGVVAWDAAGAADRRLMVWLFALNGVLNVLWSPLFFKLRRPDWALWELAPFWLSVLALAVVLFRISSLAGWIFLPYLFWVSFAGWLNWRVVALNAPFSRSFGATPLPRKPINDNRSI